ncbi:MAG TPA: LysE family transporter [Synergistaceae bacterium]|nr:LysE family transporter [Synergistaceae bacterium]
MEIDYLPLISYVCITTFTPGPNNITCASLGNLYGYRKSLPFILGVGWGFFLILLLASGISSALLQKFPALEPALRLAGGAYILWLAWKIFRASYAMEKEDTTPVLGFWKATFLQLLNIKGVLYALTLYATFLSPLAGHYGLILLSGVILGAIAVISCSLWALFGAGLRHFLHNPKLQKGINSVLALLLVYTAISLMFL